MYNKVTLSVVCDGLNVMNEHHINQNLALNRSREVSEKRKSANISKVGVYNFCEKIFSKV